MCKLCWLSDSSDSSDSSGNSGNSDNSDNSEKGLVARDWPLQRHKHRKEDKLGATREQFIVIIFNRSSLVHLCSCPVLVCWWRLLNVFVCVCSYHNYNRVSDNSSQQY